MDFPSSPTLNQTYTSAGRTWKWNGTGWSLVQNSLAASDIPNLPASKLTSGTLANIVMPAFTGDITTSAGSTITALATVNSNTGSFGSTTAVPVITVNAKGLITAVSTATLGTAAVASTGTSGNVLGFLDGTNTWSGQQTFTSTPLLIQSTATDANLANGVVLDIGGPVLRIGDATGGAKTFANGVGFKFFDAGVNHASQKFTGSAMQWGLSGTNGNSLAFDATAPVMSYNLTTGVLTLNSVTVMTTATNVTAGQLPAFTGDITTSAGTASTTLATVNSNVGTFGNAISVAQVTVNAKGLVTAVSNVAISIPNSAFTNQQNTFLNTQIISASNSTTATTYLQLKPTDYGVGAPALYLDKKSANTVWEVGLFDTSTHAGTIQFNVGTLTGPTVANALDNSVSLATTAFVQNAINQYPTNAAGFDAGPWDATSAGLYTQKALNEVVTGQWQFTNTITFANTIIGNANIIGTLTVGNATVWNANNDGSGSGLDADLLDGQDSAYYLNATNINAGTLSDSRLPTTVSSKTFSGDLNLNNFNLNNVNQINFNDPGPDEGIQWNGGNLWKIYESPDDLTTNSGGNLQFVQSTTRQMTLATNGALVLTGSMQIIGGAASTSTTTGALIITGGVGISGALNAATKSFAIPHPTKPGMTLRYGSLEGPEFGVYVRGKLIDGNVIELPDYWTGLVDPETISVNLTPIGKSQKLYVEKIENNRVHVRAEGLFVRVQCFFIVYAERKDVDKLDVEQ